MDRNGVWRSLRAVEDRERWKGIVAASFVVPRRPTRLKDWDEMRLGRQVDRILKVVCYSG